MLARNVTMLPDDFKHASGVTAIIFSAMETKGDRIKFLREAKGWSQEDLAERLNKLLIAVKEPPITRASISQWERGESKDIRNVNFHFLVEVLNTTGAYLLFGADRRVDPRDGSGKFGKRTPGSGNRA